MCGIAGFLTASTSALVENEILHRMCDAITRRGPDSCGYWIDKNANVGLGHRRLSILDPSSAGAQPMQSASGRWVIIFNGEIYNHLIVRSALERRAQAPSWRGHSDTETLLAGFDAWGILNTLKQAVGMFAMAVWDRQRGELTLARDRFGEKPLYYGWQARHGSLAFLFGSELSALQCHPSFEAIINRHALALYLRFSNVGGEHSIFEGVYKLLPGHMMTVSGDGKNVISHAYWSISDVVAVGTEQPFIGSDDDAITRLELDLKRVVKQQMLSDVPIGAFLSGGIDSSTIVALMQAQSSAPVKTFTIGLGESAYNEAEDAKIVARHLGTDHTELYVSSNDVLDVIPELPVLFSEPFADSSQIPTYLVSKLARQHVTVSLSGDGGDELFGGYNRYTLTAQLWPKISRLPEPFRALVASIIRSVSPSWWDQILGFLPYARIGEKLHKGANAISSKDLLGLYRNLCSAWTNPDSIVIDGGEPKDFLRRHDCALLGLPPVARMMALDALTYLTDDILTKVDRAAMGVSLETRAPFLDPDLYAFASSLPMNFKIRHGTSKWILREVLYRYVPKELAHRPKMGFGIPLGTWLRGPLRDWAEVQLSEHRLISDGFFHHQPIRKKWSEHLGGRRDWSQQIWTILMFQVWLEEQR